MLLRIFAILIAVCVFSPAHAERKVALLIGNATYSAPATVLKNPPNDVAALRATLEGAQFDVTVVENVGRSAMSRALASFEEKAAGADVGLIYYSGHGIEVNGENYLLPVDVKLESDREVKYEAIDLSDLMMTLSGVTKLKLVLLDACRDNPFSRSMKRLATRGVTTRGLARVESAETNMLIGYATAPGDVALDGDGANSPYAQALVRHLVKPDREVEVALRAVARDVYDATGGKQRPFITGSLFETVMLGGQSSTEGAAAGATSEDRCGAAAAHWTAISGRKERTLLEDHLKRFPDCAFSALAKQEIAALDLAPVDNGTAINPAATVDAAPLTECDRLIADPYDEMKLASVNGVEFRDIVVPDALDACRAAIAKYPRDVRLRYQLGRALDKTNENLDALVEYRNAAADGYTAAMVRIGVFYEEGYGVDVNYGEAMRWYKSAADLGSKVGLNNVGYLYQMGRGVEVNYAEAMKWYRKGADAGNNVSTRNVGYMYQFAMGVDQNYGEALYWYRKSAEAGNSSAFNDVGYFYHNALGVPRDYGEAMKWYRKAADAGITISFYQIGTLYQFGHGVPKDLSEAMNWYKRGSEAGKANATYQVGLMYSNGWGTPKNDDEAARYLEKALQDGFEFALKELTTNFKNWPIGTRKALQMRLKESGRYDGAVDGKFGPGTIKALQAIFNTG